MSAANSVKRPLGVSTLFVLDLLFGVVWIGAAVLSVAIGRNGLGWILAGIAGTLAGICFAAAVGLLRYRPIGRSLNILLGFFSLIFFPVGTVLGGLMLQFLFSGPVKLMFSGRHPDTLSAEERAGLPEPNSGLALLIAAPLLGVVAPFVLGIISAIAIPNLLNAVDRGKQKRSWADLQTLAAGARIYAVDYEGYPAAKDVHQLNDLLVPEYLRDRLIRDGWGHEFQVAVSEEGFILLSTGKDGLAQEDPPGGIVVNFDDDLILQNGEPYQQPNFRGVQ